MTRPVVVGLVLPLLATLLTVGPAAAMPERPGARSAAGSPVAGTTCRTFPADSWWHADVSGLPVHARSRQWLSHMSTGSDLHPDFGPSYGDGPDYGIPVTVVGRDHPRVRVRFDYASESDRVRYPLGRDTRIEGGRASDGDRHAIVVQKGTCRLYEVYAARRTPSGWRGGSGAVWSLRSNALRPDGWTSADAAGLPILPGLLRWNEVRDDRIDHAIRFTTDVTSRHHLWPARHDAGSRSSLAYPPMGARFRLRASWSAAGLGVEAKRVVAAMKAYGLVLADNGSPWFFQGEQSAAWPERLIEDLKTIPASAFVAVDTSSLKVSDDSAAVR
ncbi:hypothetical protein [Nocardioides rubriscoriae]|uniref:hypothetical protein n=1 Tax=Nocardioides rubriscoriae TaxID=642762 RepID=UPI0011DF5555|nr:hypothetical protein [Nocardioides rubriscoriae]